jgi:hypothetical protein
MRIALTAAAVCLAVIASVWIACGDEEEADVVQDPPAVATPCFAGQPGCAAATDPPHRGLTEADASAAIAIATQDETVSNLLEGVPHTVGDATGWELRDEPAGAVVLISLASPLQINRELPAVDIGVRGSEGNETYIPLPPPYYVEYMNHYEISALSIHVFVDLEREKVVQIFPAPF